MARERERIDATRHTGVRTPNEGEHETTFPHQVCSVAAIHASYSRGEPILPGRRERVGVAHHP